MLMFVIGMICGGIVAFVMYAVISVGKDHENSWRGKDTENDSSVDR